MSSFLENMAAGPRIIIVTGHFGSGKTEFSVSLAYALSRLLKEGHLADTSLALCDLDVENPYFRSRELTEALGQEGVRVYSDPYHGRNGSELQTLDPAILAPVEDKGCRVIMDTGGNATGAMILNQFHRHYGEDYRMLYIVNQNRPGTDTVEKNLFEIAEIERMTSLRVTDLISNSHFIRETTPEDVVSGYRFACEVGKQSGLPVRCAACSREVAQKISPDISMEIFPIGMHMRQTYLDRKV